MGFKRANVGVMNEVYVRKDSFQGNLWGWGQSINGALGDNTINFRSSPVQTIAGGYAWKEVSCGRYHTAAIKVDGTLWGWGDGTNGQLGTNDLSSRSSPVQTIAVGTNWKQVSCKNYNSAAIKTDGTLWLWGANSYGQLGDNTTVYKPSPVQTVAAGTNWKQVACGHYATAAIKTDGTLWTWGQNSIYGALGDNTTLSKSSPVQTIALGTNWKQVSCGGDYMLAVKTDGTLWGWGRNNNGGQLGDNTVIGKSSPVQTITGGTNWKQVACGFYHTAAIKTDGTLWTWGNNFYGQLGDNTTANKSSPVQTITGGTNWKDIDANIYHTAAVKADGTLWSWGINSAGQLGDNTTVDKSSPVQTIAGGTTWKQLSCGEYFSLAIKY